MNAAVISEILLSFVEGAFHLLLFVFLLIFFQCVLTILQVHFTVILSINNLSVLCMLVSMLFGLQIVQET